MIRGGIIRKIQVLVKEALTMAHCNWFFLVHTKHFCDVLTVHLKIGDHSKLVEALQRHYQNECYRRKPFHSGKCMEKGSMRYMIWIMKNRDKWQEATVSY